MRKLPFRAVMLLSVAAGALAPLTASAENFNEALEAAYAHNPRIASERARQESTDEGVNQALSNYRPNVSANYQVGRQKTSFNEGNDTTNTYHNTGLTVTEPLFRGGATWSSFQSAKQQVEAGAYQLSGIEQNVLLDAVTAYMDVVQANAILGLAQSNQEVLEKQLKASREKFNVGESTRTDVAQSEARLSGARAEVISGEGQLVQAIAAYERVVGHKPEGALLTPEQLPDLPLKLEDALDDGRRANPQLLTAVHSEKSAHYDVYTNEAALLPQVSLIGSLNHQYGVGIPGESQFNQDRIGVNVTIPIYQSGAEYSRIRESASVERQRKHETLDTQRGVDAQVTQAWEQLQTAIANIKMRQDQVNADQTSLQGVREESEYGSRTVLDVLNAQEEVFSAQTNLVRAQRERVVAAYTLAMQLGKLTPIALNLNVEQYDPKAHYDSVKWQPIGF